MWWDVWSVEGCGVSLPAGRVLLELYAGSLMPLLDGTAPILCVARSQPPDPNPRPRMPRTTLPSRRARSVCALSCARSHLPRCARSRLPSDPAVLAKCYCLQHNLLR